MGRHLGMGICRDVSNCSIKTKWIGYNSASLEGYFCNSTGNIWRMSEKGKVESDGKWVKFGDGDAIKVVLDCQNGKCEFWKNGEKHSTIGIEKNVKWFPVLGMEYKDFHLEIL